MDPKVKAMWTEALRSGEYEQARGYLRTDNGYCCLGVLCEVAVKNKVIPAPVRIVPGAGVGNEVIPGYGADEPIYFYDDQAYLTLPDEVREWAHLDDYNPMVTIPDEVIGVDDDGNDAYRKAVLSELNDAMSWDFNRIADRIDADL